MTDFSASDIALTGFRIVRQRPKVLLVWVAVQLVVSILWSIVMIMTMGPVLTKFSAGYLARPADPAASLALMRQMAPMYLLLIPYTFAFYSIAFATINRAVLNPEQDKFGYIRLGRAEFNQFLLMLLMLVVGIGAYIALVVVLIIVGVIFGIIFAAVGGHVGSGAGAGPAMILPLLLGVGLLCAWVFVSVRFSLASALTFATDRVNLFGSWALTRGKFWPIFGAYLISFVLGMGIALLGLILSVVVSAALGGGLKGVMTVFRPDMSSMQAFLTPARVALSIIGGFSTALAGAVLLAPPAAVYESLTDDKAATFS